MDKKKILGALWLLAAEPPRLNVEKYSRKEYFAVCRRLTVARQHAQRLIPAVVRRKEISAEDVLAAAPKRLVYDASLETWIHTPPAGGASDPADYRAAVCETMAACLSKHYLKTGRSLGYRGAPWFEFGINIARAWFDYDRQKLNKELKK